MSSDEDEGAAGGPLPRIGSAVDVHGFEEGIPLRLGGVEVPHTHGLAGHSDGDALLHAVASAMLGALALGDLGQHFPSSDPGLKGIDSREILTRVVAMVAQRGYAVGNVDVTVLAQAPKLAPHRDRIRASLSGCLGVDTGRVSVKAATTDHMGFLGRREGLACLASVLLYPVPPRR